VPADQPAVTESAVTGPPVEPALEATDIAEAPPLARRRRFVETEVVVDEPTQTTNGADDKPTDSPRKLSRRERKQLGRLRARRVRRIVRRVDPWSVLKLSLVFYACLFIVVMVAGTVLWNLAAAAGTINDIEGFIKDLGAYQSFNFEGPRIFRASLLIGLILVIALSTLNVLLAVLFNLVSDIVGGIRFTVLEEEHTRRDVPPGV
jgi:hypothetical protein